MLRVFLRWGNILENMSLNCRPMSSMPGMDMISTWGEGTDTSTGTMRSSSLPSRQSLRSFSRVDRRSSAAGRTGVSAEAGISMAPLTGRGDSG